MSEVDVAEADLADGDEAAAVTACIDAYARDPMGGGQALPDRVRARLAAGLRATPGSRVWLARVDGQVVGTIVVFVGFSTFAARPRWNVHDIAVLPGARDRGVGRALLSCVVDQAREAGCAAVTLEVRRDNPRARHLYASLGFGDGFAPMDFWERRLD